MAENDSIRIVDHRELTPNWQTFKAQTPGYMRWTHTYVLGAGEVNANPFDPVVEGAQIHVKLATLLPNNIMPPHEHPFPVIFAVARGEARWLEGPEGRPIGWARELDVVHVPAGTFYGCINSGSELFQCYIIRLPHELQKTRYNVNYPAKATEAPEVREVNG